eukprot:TRINITY_DN2942_c0_g1_i6.p1 TRINITY_DN2942_c0_g1~~TRINITY_DN2942_c0_g1_i6.p1  ORF type:complete len:238 (-),score=61.01 TRINITY_DN2942_c0_g1_i6:626-1339(-)
MRAKVVEKRKEAPLLSKHKFWSTRPVMQFDDLDKKDMKTGIIKEIKPEEIPPNPYPLPEDLEWSDIDINTKELDELYVLLRDNYIEDNESFRMKYSPEYLKWIFAPPGSYKEWCMGVRVKATKELIAFLNAAPSKGSVDGTVLDLVEVSFACISVKQRSKRLLPTLVLEIERRIHAKGIMQYYVSTSSVIFAPFTENWFYRRELDFKITTEVIATCALDWRYQGSAGQHTREGICRK